MNKSKIYLSLIAIIAAALVFNGCNKDDDDDNNNNDPPQETDNTIKGTAKDAVSFELLTDANIKLMKTDGSVLAETQLDQNGNYEFKDFADGTYNIELTANGYKSMIAKDVEFTGNKALGYPIFASFLTTTEDLTDPVSAVSGIAIDNDFLPVANAVVSISAQDETLTNGYFTSTMSSAEGFFEIGAIPLLSSDYDPISDFKLRAVKNGYNTLIQSNVKLYENQLSIVIFQMQPQSASGNTIWQEDFENDNNWKMTGYWHRQMNGNIINQAWPKYVKLAPNDESDGKIPSAVSGEYVAWYGESETGNFMGEFDAEQDSLTGGTGNDENYGTLRSPVIDLSELSEASVSFWTWFEIESVNPNEYGYDIMEVKVIDAADTNQVESIGRLNPYSDPILDDRDALPYTSGGFNQAPVWIYHTIDLTDFAGKEIMLEFDFRTEDELFNGFRGWVLDDIKVTDEGYETKSAAAKDYPAQPHPRK